MIGAIHLMNYKMSSGELRDTIRQLALKVALNVEIGGEEKVLLG